MLIGVVSWQLPFLSNWKVKSKESEFENGRRLTTGTGTSSCMCREASCPGIRGTDPRKALFTRTCMLEMGPMGIEL